jgi:hypothetical protein
MEIHRMSSGDLVLIWGAAYCLMFRPDSGEPPRLVPVYVPTDDPEDE